MNDDSDCGSKGVNGGNGLRRDLVVFLYVVALALSYSSICSHLPGLHACNALDDYVTSQYTTHCSCLARARHNVVIGDKIHVVLIGERAYYFTCVSRVM